MDTQRLYLKVCEQCGCQFESHFAVTAFPFFAIFPLKIARPPTVFVRALGESPALGHAARAAVFERRVRQILKYYCPLKLFDSTKN